MRHVHACPECYEKPVCALDCDVVPDLGTTRAGLPFGHTTVCNTCEAPTRAAELVREFSGELAAEGFEVAEDSTLFAALAQVQGLLETHHARRAAAREDFERVCRESTSSFNRGCA